MKVYLTYIFLFIIIFVKCQNINKVVSLNDLKKLDVETYNYFDSLANANRLTLRQLEKKLTNSYAILNNYLDNYYDNLKSVNIDSLNISIDTITWNHMINSNNNIYKFIDSDILSKNLFYENVNYINYVLLQSQFKDTFMFQNHVIVVKKITPSSELRRQRFYGQAFYDAKGTLTLDDDELSILVYVKNKIDISEVLLFIIYHELAHFRLNHTGPGGYYCELNKERDADCEAAKMLNTESIGTFILGATFYAFNSSNQLGDDCHPNFDARALIIKNCMR